MPRITLIPFLILLAVQAIGQVRFKTVVPQQAVVEGEAFQVQYVLEDAKKLVAINPPAFAGFRFVTGPNNYSGNLSPIDGNKPVFNAVYTLEAIRPGRFVLKGASAIVNGKVYKSNDVVIEVISKQDALKQLSKNYETGNSAYFLRPGEDAYKKIRENLFVRVMVDKKTCFAGEPLLATFKLYSRLESKSDIVKNPGFYGFTVYDMVNLEDKESKVEDINGKKFDVHTIRKVQLFPLQAGSFTIDPMEIKNRVEFSRSLVNKNTEQEIIEGVLGDDPVTTKPGTEVYETTMHTEPVNVKVNPIPEAKKPDNYSGAVGQFSIKAFVQPGIKLITEVVKLEVSLSGKGNFIQLDAPNIQWPEGIESLDPVIEDKLDKSKIPLTGSRTFIYPFLNFGAPNAFWIAPIRFSFFNPETKSYQTIKTDSVLVRMVSNDLKEELKRVEDMGKESGVRWSSRGGTKSGAAVGVFFVAIIIGSYYYFFRKKERMKELEYVSQPALNADKALGPLSEYIELEGKDYYQVLQKRFWQFLSEKFGLSGSQVNKSMLSSAMREKGIAEEDIAESVFIINSCEIGIFTDTNPEIKKRDLLDQARSLISRLTADSHSAYL